MSHLSVEFAKNPLTSAYPDLFFPRGDGLALTHWWLTNKDPLHCFRFSLFAIRGENKWIIDAVRYDIADVDDDEAYLGIIILEDENDLPTWVEGFSKLMNDIVALDTDISQSTFEATRGVTWLGLRKAMLSQIAQ